MLRVSALFEKQKARVLMVLLRHKNPGGFTYDNFLKTLKKSCALFEILSETKKGAAYILFKSWVRAFALR